MIKGIISYDISIDRYRNKLSRILSNFCTRIQYSVYQFELDEKIYKDMLKKIEAFYRNYLRYAYTSANIDDITRSIYIFLLCEGCFNRKIVFDKRVKNSNREMII